jgi:GMP synthase (glutamine-hydrolysing)
MDTRETVLVADFGSQYTQLIARRIREARVYCEVYPWDRLEGAIAALRPKGVVLSGGPASVYDEGAPLPTLALDDLGVPVLGICYGMQLLTRQLGGRVAGSEQREFGRAELTRVPGAAGAALFGRLAPGAACVVWMSHGDRLVELPPNMDVAAWSSDGVAAAVGHRQLPIFGVQFHPEVVHTAVGTELFQAFLFDICGCTPSWTPAHFIEQALANIRQRTAGRTVICGLSGGIDSSVAAALVQRAIGERLHCIFVDNGLLREGEAAQVAHTFRDELEMQVECVDASERFLRALAGVEDPEKKRKIIGRVFVEVFQERAARLTDAAFLCQGTLYPDVIESVSHRGPSHTIKTHHNVGGLPDSLHLALLEPLRELFKDEARAVGRELGLPASVLWRQPFPGPGLAVRVLGEVTPDRVALLRKADAIVRAELETQPWYGEVWQSFAVLLPVRSVGVMGDQRTYENVCAIRAVSSTDGMTAEVYPIPHEVLTRLSTRIINEVRGINRVVFDVSTKPPATIEWE